MKNKRASFGQIVMWLFIFIVGSLIVSFLIYPESFSSFTSNIKNIIPSTTSMGSSSGSTTQDPSLASCQNEIKEKSRIAKEKSVLDLDIDVREYKKFNDTISGIEYLRSWDMIGNKVWVYTLPYPEFFNVEKNEYGSYETLEIELTKEENRKYIVEYNDLIIFLVRFDYSNGGDNFKILQGITCIEGKLTDTAKRKFNLA